MRRRIRKTSDWRLRLSRRLVLVLLAGFLTFFAYSFFMENLFEKNYRPVTTTNKDLKFPISQLKTGRTEFFNVSDTAAAIRFLMLKDSTGHVHTAFDTCRECRESVLGYRQSRKYLVCAYCGLELKVEDVFHDGTRKCRPIPFNSTIRNAQVIIDVQDLLKGSEFFPSVDSVIQPNRSPGL